MSLNWTEIIVSLLGGSGLIMGLVNMIKESIHRKRSTLDNDIASINKKLLNDYNHLRSVDDKINNLIRSQRRAMKGLIICLENDRVIFDAFKNNKINGESEIQKLKLNDFIKECLEDDLKDGR